MEAGNLINVRTSPCIRCGTVHLLTLDKDKVRRWQGGEHVQNVFPEMTPGQRELLISGTCEQCFDILFRESD